MPETTTIKGKVGKIQKWKSGKGCFLFLQGDENEYYKFGSAPFREGDEICYEASPGTGSFEDKIQLGKKLPITAQTQSVPEKREAQQQKKDNGFQSADIVYKETQECIVEQCALKTAGRIVARLYPRTPEIDWQDVIDKTLLLKDKFACDILTGGETIEEPKEGE